MRYEMKNFLLVYYHSDFCILSSHKFILLTYEMH